VGVNGTSSRAPPVMLLVHKNDTAIRKLFYCRGDRNSEEEKCTEQIYFAILIKACAV